MTSHSRQRISRENFNNFPSSEFRDFLGCIRTAVEKAHRNKEQFVVHYFDKYGEKSDLPIWMLSELITFGTMSMMLRKMHRPLQKSIANFMGVPHPVLEQWLLTLNYVRNVCAHNVRLWNRRLSIRPQLPSNKKYPEWQNVDNAYPFCILLVLRLLLRACATDSQWHKRMEQLFDEYQDLPVERMGFPENWRSHVLWR